MIIFEKIRARNFMSFGNHFTEIDLEQDTNTLVVGTNGAGKSSILLDGLCYCLYGKPYRKIKAQAKMINSVNKKEMVVEVECRTPAGDKYLIRRGLKPALFEIIKNGETEDREGKKSDDQAKLEKNILGMSLKTFKQVVVLGTATFDPFMELEAADRRAIVEDLLDIQIFSTMNVLAKTRLKGWNEEFNTVDRKRDLLREKIGANSTALKSMEDAGNKKAAENGDKISALEGKIAKLVKAEESTLTKVKELQVKLGDTPKILAEKRQLARMKLQGIRFAMDGLEKQVEFFTKNDTCKTCTQKIDAKFKVDILDKSTGEIAEQKTAADSVQEILDKITEKEKLVDDVENRISTFQYEISQAQQEIRLNRRTIETLQAEMKDDNSEAIAELRGKIVALEEQLDALQDENAELEKKISEYNVIVNLLKDSGFKTQIIKQYLPVMNKSINEYMEIMNFPAAFEIDEEFNEKIKSRYRDEFSYANFSEGEKQRINLSILLTWRKIALLRNSAATNLLILDEVFDSSLDIDGTEGFMSILKNLGENTNAFVISHKGDALFERFNNVLEFYKDGNFSHLKEKVD